jgi:hypothetical protein
MKIVEMIDGNRNINFYELTAGVKLTFFDGLTDVFRVDPSEPLAQEALNHPLLCLFRLDCTLSRSLSEELIVGHKYRWTL